MKRQVVKSAQAENDIAKVLEYLDSHSSSAADRLATQIDDRCERLALQPQIGRLREELLPNLRSVVIGSYLLFYRFSPSTLEVVRFLHGSRDVNTTFHSN